MLFKTDRSWLIDIIGDSPLLIFPAVVAYDISGYRFGLKRGDKEFSVQRSQIVIFERGKGRYPKYLPYMFTEQGIAMLSTVLKSEWAILVNIEIMRAFVRLRKMLVSNAMLARKVKALEKKYDGQFDRGK